MPLAGHDVVKPLKIPLLVISIHVPLAGHDSTWDGDFMGAERRISIHVPLAGHDPCTAPHRSCRRISIHMPLAGHDVRYGRPLFGSVISIHMPLAGHDIIAFSRAPCRRISIHMPLAGHDPAPPCCNARCTHFNPHAPCGARRGLPPPGSRGNDFNPHAPCGARPGGVLVRM